MMPAMRKIAALAGIAALAVPSAALSPAACAQADAPTLELTYTTYTEGFTVLRLIADLTLTPGGYRIVVHYETVGTVGFFLPGHDVATADGSWRGDAALPAEFQTEGDWGGHPFDVIMDYADGAPVVQRLVPTQADQREPVPAALRGHTIDTASAMALLLHQMIDSGSCDLAARVFDGRRLMAIESRPGGTDTLGPTIRSFFHGPAIRCDVTGRLLAGFLRSDSPAKRKRVRQGAVWFAHPVAGLPLLPVRITFTNRWLGPATMYLTDVTAGPQPLPSTSAALVLPHPAADPPPAQATH